MITITGWTWDYLDWGMDLKRLSALTKYWTQHPALHQMIQGFLGIEPNSSSISEPESKRCETVNTKADLDDFMQMFNSANH